MSHNIEAKLKAAAAGRLGRLRTREQILEEIAAVTRDFVARPRLGG